MWYLYSGIAGKGISIGFTPATLINLINSIDKLTAIDNDNNEKVIIKGRDFDLDYGWIFYRKPDNHSQISYKRKWYSLTDPEAFENNNYFIKAYPWEYEKEFRIVFHNRTDVNYSIFILNISSVYDKLKIKLAPEISNEEFNKLLPNSAGFKKFLAGKVAYSKLGINMDLCKRNYDSFLAYIQNEINARKPIDTDKICEIINPNCNKKEK